jgi:hypothetical protein
MNNEDNFKYVKQSYREIEWKVGEGVGRRKEGKKGKRKGQRKGRRKEEQ